MGVQRALFHLVWLATLSAGGCRAEAPVSAPAPPPAVKQAAANVCEHGMPSAVCTRCNPALANVFRAKGDWCAEHAWPESLCPVCAPGRAAEAASQASSAPAADAPRGGAQYEGRRVTLSSPDLEAASGIESVAARATQGERVVECMGQLAFDQASVAEVRALVPGIVRAVHARQGQLVRQGQALFELESREVSELQGLLRTAQARVKSLDLLAQRQRSLLDDGVLPRGELERTELELVAAREEAASAQNALRMSGARAASGRYTLHAPLAGQLVDAPAPLGALATDATLLARIVDAERLWVECEVAASEAGALALGQPIWGKIEGAADVFQGQLDWIAPEVDAHHRTVTARATIKAAPGMRAQQFVRGFISVAAGRGEVMAVPVSSVQRMPDADVVFVRHEAGAYEARVVTRRGEQRGELWVSGRLKPGEKVVTTGAVLLKTELLPGSIGAGCCEPAPGGGK